MKTHNKKQQLLPDYRPETIDELIWSPYYCDDCSAWHNNWIGLEIEKGEILDVSCEPDGDWERDGTGERATESSYAKLNEELIEQTNKAQTSYLEHCAETGEDPLNEFFVQKTIKRKERWQAHITPWIGLSKYGFAVTDAKRGKHTFKPFEFPSHVSEFLGLKKIGDRFCMEGITRFEDMTGADAVKPNSISFTVERETLRPSEIVKREIIATAKRSLERRAR